MSVSGSIFLTGGWIIVAFDPPLSWVSLVLFGLALLAFAIQMMEERS